MKTLGLRCDTGRIDGRVDPRALESASPPSHIATFLYGLRCLLGWVFDWDRKPMQSDDSFLERLSPRDRCDSEMAPRYSVWILSIGRPDRPILSSPHLVRSMASPTIFASRRERRPRPMPPGTGVSIAKRVRAGIRCSANARTMRPDPLSNTARREA